MIGLSEKQTMYEVIHSSFGILAETCNSLEATEVSSLASLGGASVVITLKDGEIDEYRSVAHDAEIMSRRLISEAQEISTREANLHLATIAKIKAALAELENDNLGKVENILVATILHLSGE